MKRPYTVMRVFAVLVLAIFSTALMGGELTHCAPEHASMPHHSMPRHGDPCCPTQQQRPDPSRHCPGTVCISADAEGVAVTSDVDEESGVRDRFAGMIAVEGLGAIVSECVTTTAPVEAAPPGSAGSSVQFYILRI